MNYLKLLAKRFRMWRTYRHMARVWREATGGSCRYQFHIGGARMAFSATECQSMEEAERIFREAANVIKAINEASK